MRRRTFLERGSLVGIAAFAGCSTPDGDGGTESPVATEPPATRTPSPADTTIPSPSPTTSIDTAPSTPTSTPDGTPTDPATATPGTDQTVVVGPAGALRFEPESFDLLAGGTVRWVWDAGGHNVIPSETPDGSDWSGTSGGTSTTYGAEHQYAEQFDVPGSYEYYCSPHRSAGMTGSFTVV